MLAFFAVRREFQGFILAVSTGRVMGLSQCTEAALSAVAAGDAFSAR